MINYKRNMSSLINSYLFLFLSIYLYLFIYFSISISIYLYLYLSSIYLGWEWSVCPTWARALSSTAWRGQRPAMSELHLVQFINIYETNVTKGKVFLLFINFINTYKTCFFVSLLLIQSQVIKENILKQYECAK